MTGVREEERKAAFERDFQIPVEVLARVMLKYRARNNFHIVNERD